MFEDLGLDGWTPVQAALVFGAALGLAYGALAQRSRFCLRRALLGDDRADRRRALAVWISALAVACLGLQGAALMGWADIGATRFVGATVAVQPIVAGGLMFGVGMALTRGCASRLTVLAGSGNMRAASCILVFMVAAHATMKGALNFVPQVLAGQDWTPPAPTLDAMLGLPGIALAGVVAVVAAALVAWARPGKGALAMGAVIGLLIPLGWVGTGFVLADDFDPIPYESLAFTRPAAEALFWTVAGTAIPAGFGTGLFFGTVAGAFLAALAGRELRFESFSAPGQMARYMAGAVLMGVGGVMAAGCTVGAGLGGVPTFGFAALAALGAIVVGALGAGLVLKLGRRRGNPAA